MLSSLKIYLPTLIICLIAMLSPSCGKNSERANPEAVKEYLTSVLKDDTASYIIATLARIDSLQLDDPKSRGELYQAVNKVTYDMHYAGDDGRAVTILRAILDILKNSDYRSPADTRHMLNIYVRLGATFTDMGMPGIGLDYYIAGIEQCNDSTLADYKAMLYNNIGILYGERHFLDKAEEYFSRSLEINLAGNNHHGICLNYANLAEVYALGGEIRKAQEATQRSLDYIDQNKYPDRLASMRLQQGMVYEMLGQHDVALLRFNSALHQFRELGDIAGEINADLHIGKNYLSTGRPDSAAVYADRAMQLCRIHGRDDDMTSTLATLADISEANGNIKQALDRMKLRASLADSLRTEESRLRLSNWEDLGAYMISGPSEESDNNPQWAWIAAAIFLTVAIGAAVIADRCRKKTSRAEIEAARDTALTNAKLEDINRELTTMSLEKLQLHEGITDVAESLQQVLLELNPKETAKRDRIRSLLARLGQLSSFNADDEFKLSFGRVHPDFYNSLSNKYPDLTPRDLRLCAFLYLGMTTKEIASLTYREVRSVESARNRLRKKLSLELTDDLTAHLRTI